MKSLKRKTLLTNIGAIFFALLIGVYMLFQVFSNLSQRIVTADATFVRAEDKISVRGVFIRSEKIVYGENTGLVAFLAYDGEKVAKEDDVARFFGDEQSLELFRKTQELQKQIDSAEYAASHLSDGTDSLKLDTLIKMHMNKMADKLAKGQVLQAEEFSSKLDALIVQRSASGVAGQDYSTAIDDLRAEKKALEAQIGNSSVGVPSESSGYFVSTLDGGEQDFSVDKLESITADQIKQASTVEVPSQTGTMGKIIDAYEWYFAVNVSEAEAAEIKKLKTATLRFSQIAADDIEAEIYSIRQDNSGEYVVIFKSGMVNSAILGTRAQSVEIIKKEYKGIKIPKEALRQKEDKWGVYCLVGARVVFKEAEIIYQTDSYYIAPDDSAASTLSLYDKIVVRAKDIESMKVVK